ncbi:MAG TPA: hypothetical protein VGA27_08725 [Candidatus Binatia bacterium]
MLSFARYTDGRHQRLMKTCNSALLSALITWALPALPLAAANSPITLCRGEERVIFSCPIAGPGKVISLCASPTIDTKRGYLQYRFGKSGAVELQFPQARANTQLAFRYAHYFRAQVDRTEVSFDNQDYRYVIFDYFEGDVKPTIRETGVRVNRHGGNNHEQEFKCTGTPLSKLGF